MEMNKLLDEYGRYTFNDETMKERIPKSTYKAFHEALDKGEPLSKEVATVIANAMKIWAVENGATHFTHWFMPMTGLTAEKHDAFLEPDGNGGAVLEFSGKTLRKGEPDASSFPSGGIRATFEARGYTAWDCTSPAFVKDGSLYIPTLFCSYTGEALDKKTPLLRACDALSASASNLLTKIGLEGVDKVTASVGAEQEYFLVLDEYWQKRVDLKLTGRTLYGAPAPKGQELEDHYFGSIKRKVGAFMKDLDTELWKYGIPSKTKHNEVAPAQHEVACVYTVANVTADNNALVMQLSQDIAKKHGLRCLLHEKPFEGVNGSGKHNNWSLMTNTGINLFNPGPDPINNKPFLATLACALKGVDEYAELLRLSAACAGNDHRLGANEAPPAIVSAFVGDDLNKVIKAIIDGEELNKTTGERFTTGVSVIPDFSKDSTDRNRTSPFAFTGNKFEFRMVGSADSIASPNTTLNAIVAEAFCEAADVLEKADDFDMAVHDLIKKYMTEHHRIIFNGNGYSDEWVEEAAKRGLPNIKSMIESANTLTTEKAVQLFEKFHIFTRAELESREEIIYETYAKSINIEALTMIDMASKQIIPAVVKYSQKLAKTVLDVKAAGVEPVVQSGLLAKVNSKLTEMKEALSVLEKEEAAASAMEDVKAQSFRYKDVVIPAMDALRAPADELEMMVDKADWPFPTYGDLMFEV